MKRSQTNLPQRKRAKIFKNGNSQAVRLPMQFRLEGNNVDISFHGRSVLLTPIVTSIDKLPEILQSFEDSFNLQLVEQVIYND